MKLLVNCDQVFDILTRGPFPTGEPSDEAVEQHLRACHDCRRLAEALRPAVELLHEAVAHDQAFDLPEYQGTLPHSRPADLDPAALGLRRINRPVRRGPPLTPDYIRLLNVARYVAAVVLVAAVGTLALGLMMSPGARDGDGVAMREAPSIGAPPPRLGALRPDPLVTLASLQLPAVCFPADYRPLSAEQAAELIDALQTGEHKLRCCTECHNAAATGRSQPLLVATVTRDNCLACHRG